MGAQENDPAEQIAQALFRIRGRRGARRGEGGRGGGPRGHHGHAPWDPRAAHGFPPHAEGAGWQGAHHAAPARLRLLEALATSAEPLSVSALGDAIGVDQPRASRLVQQCVGMGLVRREADPDDARRTRIALTEQGRLFAQGIRRERRDALRSALEGFSDSEQRELARLLGKLAEAWPEG